MPHLYSLGMNLNTKTINYSSWTNSNWNDRVFWSQWHSLPFKGTFFLPAICCLALKTVPLPGHLLPATGLCTSVVYNDKSDSDHQIPSNGEGTVPPSTGAEKPEGPFPNLQTGDGNLEAVRAFLMFLYVFVNPQIPQERRHQQHSPMKPPRYFRVETIDSSQQQ